MKLLKQIRSETVPIQIALLSFFGGTILFISHLFLPDEIVILIVGWCFVVAALLVNFCTLSYLIYKIFYLPSTGDKTREEIHYILSNIPITALYLFIIINQNNLF